MNSDLAALASPAGRPATPADPAVAVLGVPDWQVQYANAAWRSLAGRRGPGLAAEWLTEASQSGLPRPQRRVSGGFDLTIEPLPDPDGCVRALLVTARRTAGEAGSAGPRRRPGPTQPGDNADRLHRALGACGVGIWDWDVASGRVEWAAAPHPSDGLPPIAGITTSIAAFRALVHPADGDQFGAALDRALAGEANFEIEYRMLRSGGETRWVSSRGTVLRDAAGRPVHMIGIDLDVTATQEARHAEQQADALLRAIGQCSPDLIYAKDREGRFLFANPATIAVIGRPSGQVLGRTSAAWHPNPEQARAAAANDRHVLETGRAAVFQEAFDSIAGTRVFRTAKAPLRDARGTVSGIVGVASDITEAAGTEAALREAVEMREMLIREADHRIKNSLQLVAGQLNLQERRSSSPTVRAALRTAFARILAVGAAHRTLYGSKDLRSVDLAQVLRDLAAHADGFAPLVQVTCDLPEHLPFDANRAIPLGLVASELLTNAVKHGFAAEATGLVTLHASLTAEHLVFTVSDDGKGMPPPEERTAAGGLGSSVIHVLTRQMGATLETKSAPAAGTTVTLRLPREPPHRSG